MSTITTVETTSAFLMITSMSISRYRTMAEANASGTQPSRTAVYSENDSDQPKRNGMR
jgi:hypothetical protein